MARPTITIADHAGACYGVQRALDLRGDGYEAHHSAAQLIELIKERNVRLADVIRVLRAALPARDERPFQMHTSAFGLAAEALIGADVLHRASQLVRGDGQRCEAEGRDAVVRIKLCQMMYLLGGAVARVYPHGTVSVHVDKAGDDIRPAGVHSLAGRK